MAESYMQLLDNASQVSGQIFNQIDNTLGRDIANEQNEQKRIMIAAQFEEEKKQNTIKQFEFGAQMGLREREFQADMMFKAADATNRARMTEVEIENIKSQNEIRAKEFELNKELNPLKIENEKMRLESQRSLFKKQKTMESESAFNNITTEFDDNIAYDIIKNQSTQQAQDYLSLKAQWRDKVSKGESFDSSAYKIEVDLIREKYKDSPAPTTGWTPDRALLFEKISPKLGELYNKTNPIQEKNANSLAASMLSMTEAQFGKASAEYGSLYEPQEIAQLGIARKIIEANSSQIEKMNQSNQRLQSELTELDAVADKNTIISKRNQIAENNNIIEKSSKQNNSLLTNSALGKYGVQPDEVKDSVPPKREENIDYTKPEKALGYQNPDTSYDPKGVEIFRNLNEIKGIFGEKEEDLKILKGIDMGWFNGTEVGKVDDQTKTNIRSRIEENIESLGGVAEIMSESSVTALLKKIPKGANIPLSEEVKKILTVAHKKDQNFTSQIKSFKMATEKTSQINFSGTKDDIFTPSDQLNSKVKIDSLLSKIKNKVEREIVATELFAALATAAITESVQK